MLFKENTTHKNKVVSFAHSYLLFGFILFVVLGGLWLWKNDKLNTRRENHYSTEIINQDNVTPTNWKNYTNLKYGYSYQYPGDWSLKEVDETYNIYSEIFSPGYEQTTLQLISGGKLIVRVNNSNAVSRQSNSVGDSDADFTTFIAEEDIEISGVKTNKKFYKGILGVGENAMLVDVEIKKDESVYSLSCYYLENSDDILDTCNQILSSFEFVEE